jgi:hypothetical protein
MKRNIKAFLLVGLIAISSILFVGCSIGDIFNKTKEHTVTFNGNGGLLVSGSETQTIDHGQSAIAPVYEKEGYVFNGFSSNFSSVKQDLNIIAEWTVKTYTVTFNGKGGLLVSGSETQTIDHGQSAVAPVYEKDGYVFIGFSTQIDGSGIIFNENAGILSDVILYSMWEREFNVWSNVGVEPSNDGTNYAISTPEELGYIAKMTNTVADWSSGKTFTLSNDIDLAGKYWTPIGLSSSGYKFEGTFYGLRYNINNLTIDSREQSSLSYNAGFFGSAFSANFDGINLTNLNIYSNRTYKNIGGIVGSFSGALDTTITNSSVNGTIEATQEDAYMRVGGIVGEGYNTFDNVKGSVDINITVINDEAIVGGLIGLWWSDNNSIITNSYNTGNIIVDQSHPSFKRANVGGLVGRSSSFTISTSSKIEKSYNEGNVTVTSTHISTYVSGILGFNNKKTDANTFVAINETYNSGVLTVVNAGNIFGISDKLGIYAESNIYIATAPIAGDLASYANQTEGKTQAFFLSKGWDFTANTGAWEILEGVSYPTLTANISDDSTKTHIVTFNGNGGLLVSGSETQTIDHGQSAVAPVYEKDGYVFIGFSADFSNIQYNLKIDAEWATNTHTVTFNGKGGLLVSGSETQIVNHEQSAIAPVYVKEGYDFMGFSADFSSVESNLTVFVEWVIKIYTVTFDSNGGVLNNQIDETQVIMYNNPAMVPSYTKEGYIFAGWDNDYKCIKQNLIITALWQQVLKNKVNIPVFRNGQIDLLNESYSSGDLINLNIIPDNYYNLESIYYKNVTTNNTVPIVNFSFIMPDSAVVIYANFALDSDYVKFDDGIIFATVFDIPANSLHLTILSYSLSLSEYIAPNNDSHLLKNKISMFNTYRDELYENISSLKGVEALINLEYFYLYKSRVKSLSELETLTNLKVLYIMNAKVDSLQPLINHTNLIDLRVQNNLIDCGYYRSKNANQLNYISQIKANNLNLSIFLYTTQKWEYKPEILNAQSPKIKYLMILPTNLQGTYDGKLYKYILDEYDRQYITSLAKAFEETYEIAASYKVNVELDLVFVEDVVTYQEVSSRYLIRLESIPNYECLNSKTYDHYIIMSYQGELPFASAGTCTTSIQNNLYIPFAKNSTYEKTKATYIKELQDGNFTSLLSTLLHEAAHSQEQYLLNSGYIDNLINYIQNNPSDGYGSPWHYVLSNEHYEEIDLNLSNIITPYAFLKYLSNEVDIIGSEGGFPEFAWYISPQQYILSLNSGAVMTYFDYNGNIIKINTDNYLTQPSQQVREGYIFEGWSIDIDEENNINAHPIWNSIS